MQTFIRDACCLYAVHSLHICGFIRMWSHERLCDCGCCMYIPYAAPTASMQALGNKFMQPSYWQVFNRLAKHTYHNMHNCLSQMGIWQKLLLQVNPKRHNVPGMKERGRGRGRGPPRGRGFFPRGRGRGAFYGGFDPSYGYGGYGGGYGYDNVHWLAPVNVCC